MRPKFFACFVLVLTIAHTSRTFAQHSSINEANNGCVTLQISSGFGFSVNNIQNIFWDVQILTPILNLHRSSLWIGIIPTLDPVAARDEAAPDGFFPLAIQYEFDLNSAQPMTFLYAIAGTGLQFGDQSNHSVFQAVTASAGCGVRFVPSGFVGELGITTNNVPNWRAFLVLHAGIEF